MNFKVLIISVILISMVLLGSTTYLSSLQEGYGEEIDLTGFNRTLERLETQQDLADKIMGNITDMKLEKPTVATALLVPYKMIQTAWSGMKMAFNSVWTLEAIFVDAATASGDAGLPIPSWVIPSVILIIVGILIVIIIEAFMRWKLQS